MEKKKFLEELKKIDIDGKDATQLYNEISSLAMKYIRASEKPNRSARIHIAGGKPAQPAVAERRVFDFLEKGDIYALFFEDLRYLFQYAEFQ